MLFERNLPHCYLADDHAAIRYLQGNATAAAWLDVPSLVEIWQTIPLDLQDTVTDTIVSGELNVDRTPIPGNANPPLGPISDRKAASR
jgi:hypothetical protein